MAENEDTKATPAGPVKGPVNAAPAKTTPAKAVTPMKAAPAVKSETPAQPKVKTNPLDTEEYEFTHYRVIDEHGVIYADKMLSRDEAVGYLTRLRARFEESFGKLYLQSEQVSHSGWKTEED